MERRLQKGDIVRRSGDLNKFVLVEFVNENLCIIANAIEEDGIIIPIDFLELVEHNKTKRVVINKEERSDDLKKIINECLQEKINEVDYSILLNSKLITHKELSCLTQEQIEHLKFINEILRISKIVKINSEFILEDIKVNLLNLDFDIIMYIDTISTIDRYPSLVKSLKEADLNTREVLYKKIAKCSTNKEIHNMLTKINNTLSIMKKSNM